MNIFRQTYLQSTEEDSSKSIKLRKIAMYIFFTKIRRYVLFNQMNPSYFANNLNFTLDKFKETYSHYIFKKESELQSAYFVMLSKSQKMKLYLHFHPLPSMKA